VHRWNITGIKHWERVIDADYGVSNRCRALVCRREKRARAHNSVGLFCLAASRFCESKRFWGSRPRELANFISHLDDQCVSDLFISKYLVICQFYLYGFVLYFKWSHIILDKLNFCIWIWIAALKQAAVNYCILSPFNIVLWILTFIFLFI
jgi:hypothetical protein